MTYRDQTTCPDLASLKDFAAGRAGNGGGNLSAHVSTCVACAEAVVGFRQELASRGQALVPPELRMLSSDSAAHFREIPKVPQPPAPSFGELWTTVADPDGSEAGVQLRLVAIVDEASQDGALMVAPFSIDVEYIGPADLLIPPDEGPLGYQTILEVWNALPVLRDQLGRCLGSLRQPSREYLGLLYRESLGEEIDRSRIAARVGPAILAEEDPRMAFQEEEVAECVYLRVPFLKQLAEYEEESATATEAMPTTFGELVVVREDEFAPHVSPQSLERLRQVHEPIEVFLDRNVAMRTRALREVATAAMIRGDEAMRRFFKAALRVLSELSAEQQQMPAYARRQRSGRRRRRGT